MDYFFKCKTSTFSLENSKCYFNTFFCVHITKLLQIFYSITTYSRIIFLSYVYLKDIYKTLKRIRKTQFVPKLTMLLNLQISKINVSLYKENH